MAGTLAVALHNRFMEMQWLSKASADSGEYAITSDGAKALKTLGIDLEAPRAQRRRFAYTCLDWSERRPHLAGVLGAALLKLVLQHKWVVKDLDSRALRLTSVGRNQLRRQFGLQL